MHAQWHANNRTSAAIADRILFRIQLDSIRTRIWQQPGTHQRRWSRFTEMQPQVTSTATGLEQRGDAITGELLLQQRQFLQPITAIGIEHREGAATRSSVSGSHTRQYEPSRCWTA